MPRLRMIFFINGAEYHYLKLHRLQTQVNRLGVVFLLSTQTALQQSFEPEVCPVILNRMVLLFIESQ